MGTFPVPGKIVDFLTGLDILRPYAGGTTLLSPQGLTIHVMNVQWPSISEPHQHVLKQKGWNPHYAGNYPMWTAEG